MVVAWATAQPAEPFWGGDRVGGNIAHAEKGEQLEHALELTKARLRGLQRHGERERKEHEQVEQAFAAMSETLHTVLEPKLRKARERVNETAEADAAAATEAEKLDEASEKATAGLDAAKEQVATATARMEEADKLMRAAQEEKAAAEADFSAGRHTASLMEQKVLFTEAQARGAKSTADTRHKLAEDTLSGEKHLESIANIEKDRVEQGSIRAVATTEMAEKENEKEVSAAEEDINVLQDKLEEWQSVVDDADRQKAVDHAQELQRQADEAAQQAVALSHAKRQPVHDWAWEPPREAGRKLSPWA